MFCKNCGKEIESGVVFCSYCGIKNPDGTSGKSNSEGDVRVVTQKWEHVNKMYKNKNSMLEDYVVMKREGWSPIQCTKMSRKFPPSLYSIFVGEVFYLNYERGIPLTDQEKKDQEALHKVARFPGNCVAKIEGWLEERKK